MFSMLARAYRDVPLPIMRRNNRACSFPNGRESPGRGGTRSTGTAVRVDRRDTSACRSQVRTGEPGAETKALDDRQEALDVVGAAVDAALMEVRSHVGLEGQAFEDRFDSVRV